MTQNNNTMPNKKEKLDIGSSLTIDTIKELLVKFASLAQSTTKISFHSTLLETIDQTGIQFLIYSQKVAKEKGFDITFDFNVSAPSKDLISKTGFDYLFEQ